MIRLQVRRPAAMRRRSVRARRLAVAHDAPIEYSTYRPASRGLVVGTGILGAAVIVELIIGLAVLA